MKAKLSIGLGLILALSLSISNLAFSASIFSVVGTVRNADGTLASTGLEVTVTNQTRGLIDTTTVGEQEVGIYGVVFVDMENKTVAAEGDILNVTVRDVDKVITSVAYQLTAEDIAKGRAVVDVKIGPAPKPEASFTYSPQLEKYLSGQEIIFEAAESENIVSYEWDFGDDETDTGVVIGHRFKGTPDEPAMYIVVLTVRDSAGYTDVYAMDITVAPIEKSAEIVYEIIGEPTTIGAKIWYNWVGTDQGKNVYKVSKIDDWNSYFVGYYDVSIESKERTLWSKRIIATPVQGKPYAPEQLLIVGDEDWLSVKAYGVTELELLSLISIILAATGVPTGPLTSPIFIETATTYLAPDYVDTSDYPLIDIEDVELAPLTIGHLASPGELRIYDSEGHVTGLVDGEVREEIPNSAYFNDTVVILSASSSYRYEVAGTEEGTYGLGVITVENGEADAFVATDIPTTANTLHRYTIDWDALSKGEEGVTVEIDENGDGTFEKTAVTDSELTQDEYLTITQSDTKGDINDDGNVRSNDAVLALRIAAGIMKPTEYQKWAADMNDDGKIRSNDAMLILRKAAGLAAPGKDSITNPRGQITVALAEFHGVAGENITVPVNIDDNTYGLAAGDISISYDPAVLHSVSISSELGVLLVSNISEPGMVRIAFATTDRLRDKTIATLQFNILADDISPLTFQSAEFYQSDASPIKSRKIDGKFTSWTMPSKHSALLQNFPNPFNPDTWIPYQLVEDTDVTIRIYDVAGRFVRTLILGKKPAGIYISKNRAAYWDGRNDSGETVGSGLYFYTLEAGRFRAARKMVIAR